MRTIARLKYLPVAVVLMMLADGCGDRQGRALKGLGERSYTFQLEDFHRAAEAGDLEAVLLFLDGGMEADAPDAHGNTALLKASARGFTKVVETLVARGADASRAGTAGLTPLIAGAGAGSDDLIRVLLKAGADVDAKDEKGYNALTKAVYHGNARAVEVLAAHTASDLDDALLLAALRGHVEVIDVLIKNGAYKNATSEDKRTPMMFAAKAGQREACEFLVRRGANRFALDKEGRTASVIARQNGHEELADYLGLPPGSEEVAVAEDDGLVDPAGTKAAGETGMEDEAGADSPAGPAARVASAESPGEGDLSDPAAGPGARPAAVEKEESMKPARPPSIDGVKFANGPAASGEAGASGSFLRQLEMRGYRETFLPIMFRGLEGEKAVVQVLYGANQTHRVGRDERIGDTSFRVTRIRRRLTYSKRGQGAPVDVSELYVEDIKTGDQHLLIKDIATKSSDGYAILGVKDGTESFTARAQDEFSMDEDPANAFRVLDVCPTQVVIEAIESGKTITLTRRGAVGAG